MDGFIGEIRLMTVPYTPQYWLPCDGRILNIMAAQVLFAVIGNKFGGDGRTTFALPKLNGQVPIGDAAPGQQGSILGKSFGKPNVDILQNNMPSHTHTVTGATVATTSRVATAEGNWLGGPAFLPNSGSPESAKAFVDTPGPSQATNMNPGTVSAFVGGSQPHENRQPYLAVGYYICVDGEFPTPP